MDWCILNFYSNLFLKNQEQTYFAQDSTGEIDDIWKLGFSPINLDQLQ